MNYAFDFDDGKIRLHKSHLVKFWCIFVGKYAGGVKWRTDRRCGNEFPLPDRSGPTQCNPNSVRYCCSKYGYCGGPNPSNPAEDHCAGGVNYRTGK